MVWYLDTDPQPFPRSGAGTATAIPFGTQNWSLPFFADYAILFKANFGFELRRWNGSAWLPQSLAGVWFYPGCPALYKFGIPLDRFEVPKRIYVVGFSVSDEPSAETTYASWPQDSLVGGDGYKLAGVFAHWFGFALDSGLSPNDPSFHDQTLPVELQSFTVE
jgi:hypothetical protein